LYLKLLPLVAKPEDTQTLETLIYRTPAIDDFQRALFIDPYVALADRVQLQKLAATFIDPPPATQEDEHGVAMLFYTYRALREHRARREVAEVWYQFSRKMVAANHVMADLVLDDYRKINDWRFVGDALRLLADKSSSQAVQRACLMYLFQAEAVRPELSESIETVVRAYERDNPQRVKMVRHLLIDEKNHFSRPQKSR
jgi:hypothetical protein